jgi:hypothetical protein
MTHINKFGKLLLMVVLPFAFLMTFAVIVSALISIVASLGPYSFNATFVGCIDSPGLWIPSVIVSIICTAIAYIEN